MEALLETTSTSQLHAKPNVVYDLTQLKAITCKVKKGAPLVLSELILETKNGTKQTFGVRPAEFKRACEYLRRMYPSHCELA